MSRVCGSKTRRVLFTPKSRRLCASFSPLVRGFVLHSLFGIMIRRTDLWRGVFSAVMISQRTKRKRLFVNSQRLPFAKKKAFKRPFSFARLRENERALRRRLRVLRVSGLGVALRPAVQLEQREARELVLQPPVRALARSAAVPHAPAARAPPELVPPRLDAAAQRVRARRRAERKRRQRSRRVIDAVPVPVQ
jgi:hypothetical protein